MQEEEQQGEIPAKSGKPKTKRFWAALIVVDCAALAVFSILAYKYLDEQPAMPDHTPKVSTPAPVPETKPLPPAPPQPVSTDLQTQDKSSASAVSPQAAIASTHTAKIAETSKQDDKISVSTKSAAPQHSIIQTAQPVKSTATPNGKAPGNGAKKAVATIPAAAKAAAKPPAQPKPHPKAAQPAAAKAQNNGKYAGIAPSAAKSKETAPPVEKARPIYFNYQDNTAKTVAVTGSFTIWKPVPMKKKGGYWEATIYIHSGKYEYSLIVDGKTMADPAAPSKGPDRSFLLVP